MKTSELLTFFGICMSIALIAHAQRIGVEIGF